MVKIVSQVLLPDLKPHCASERFHSEAVMSPLRMTCAKIFPAMETNEIPLYFPQSALFSLFFENLVIANVVLHLLPDALQDIVKIINVVSDCCFVYLNSNSRCFA